MNFAMRRIFRIVFIQVPFKLSFFLQQQNIDIVDNQTVYNNLKLSKQVLYK